MHQTKKGKQWHFGMKAHVGVDSKTKLIHTAVATAANVADRDGCPICCTEKRRGSGAIRPIRADRGHSRGAPGPGPHPSALSLKRPHRRGERAKNRTKSRVRAKVEHVFGVMKNIFGFRKTRYRGLAKNLHRLEVTAALANLYMVRRRLLNA